ncbi:hypothetical protein [uncultured Sphingopyxis sp.]|uniref:hypothetical protein n=1 Tax=uncultured Sphingopyxis sp. TaxID=310581 RepID=UPI00259A78B6|nr:hypothetical protein [uncultured Sphingopyxis sp.]
MSYHPVPTDKQILKAFEKGRQLGRQRHKYGHTQGPGPSKSEYLRDAWHAGYEEGYEEGTPAEDIHDYRLTADQLRRKRKAGA